MSEKEDDEDELAVILEEEYLDDHDEDLTSFQIQEGKNYMKDVNKKNRTAVKFTNKQCQWHTLKHNLNSWFFYLSHKMNLFSFSAFTHMTWKVEIFRLSAEDV